MNPLGPVVIGLAAWLASGTLTVASAASSSARLGAFGPWWVGVAGMALALAVPGWRRTPRTVWPALFTVLPWLPVPLPAAALIFTGPLAWAPIAAALALAVGVAPVRWLSARLHLDDRNDATVVAFVLAALIGGLSAWSADVRTPGGDEPHYLIITQSLLADGDLDIDNQHAEHSYSAFYGGDLDPHIRRRGAKGEALSIHAPGLPVLVAPLFQFFGYTGARFLMVLLSAIGSMLVWRIGWRVTDSAGAAWFGWAAVVLTPTFAMQSFLVFPDGPGFLAVAMSVLLVVQLSRGDVPGLLPFFLNGLALAAMPWLHTRFALLAAGFGVVILLRLWAADAPAADRLKRVIAWLAVPAVSAVCWLLFFKVFYGTFDPRAPYPPEEQRLAWVLPAIIGLFYDGQFGVAAYAPAMTAAFIGWWRTAAGFGRRLGVELFLIAFVYLAAVTTVRMWWAGSSPPARFLMAVLPFLAAPAAVAWARASQTSRALWAALAGAGAVVTALLVWIERAELLWNNRNAEPQWLEWLSPVANLSRVWPGFFWDEPRFPLHVALWLAAAGGAWWLARRFVGDARQAVAVWAVASVAVVAPMGWALAHAAPLDPAPSQLALAERHGAGAHVYEIGAARFARIRSLAGLSVHPMEPGAVDEAPAPLYLAHVPAARYVAKVTSTSPVPRTLSVWIDRRDATWRTFTVPGAGTFAFPFVVPGLASRLVIDTDPEARSQIAVELGIEAVLPGGGVGRMRSAARFGQANVLFLDDKAYVEAEGFWVRGREAARFAVLPMDESGAPVTGGVVTLRVQNGGAAGNAISIESGTFQKVIVLAPFADQQIEVPAGEGGLTSIRIAAGEGFVPADRDPTSSDRRLLGAWIQIR